MRSAPVRSGATTGESATIPIERRETKSGQVRWRVRIRRQGSPDIYATFGRKRDAIDFERQASPDAERRRYIGSEPVRWTVEQLIHAFVGAGKLEELSPSYRPTREGHLRFWREALGEAFARSVDPPQITEQRRRLDVAGPTWNRYLSTLSRVYRWACAEGRLSHNPVRDVERSTERAPVMRWLRDDERERLLEACRASSDGRLYPLVLLALTTGGRRDSELMALDWEDIDFGAGLVTFRTSKNGRPRSLPLEPEAAAALVELEPQARGKIFATRRALYWPRSQWRKAIEDAGIEHLRFHDLRHSFGSYLAHAGATAREICEALGDKTLDMALRYSRISKTHTHDVVSRMHRRRQIGATAKSPELSSAPESPDDVN